MWCDGVHKDLPQVPLYVLALWAWKRVFHLCSWAQRLLHLLAGWFSSCRCFRCGCVWITSRSDFWSIFILQFCRLISVFVMLVFREMPIISYGIINCQFSLIIMKLHNWWIWWQPRCYHRLMIYHYWVITLLYKIWYYVVYSINMWDTSTLICIPSGSLFSFSYIKLHSWQTILLLTKLINLFVPSLSHVTDSLSNQTCRGTSSL